MNTLRRIAATLGVGLLATLGIGSAPARADFDPVFVSAVDVANTTVFTYTINFSTNNGTESLAIGDFVTLYDVGPVSSISLPAGLFSTQDLTGQTAPGTSPVDDPTILNLTLGYFGTTLMVDTTFVNVTLTTPLATTRLGLYTSQDTASNGGKDPGEGRVIVPLVRPVPEPGSIALLLVGSAGAFGLARRRKMPRSAA